MTNPWPVGVMKYSRTCTRLSRNRGLRLIRDSSARMSSYCRSRYPTISEKLSRCQLVMLCSSGACLPGLVVDLVTEPGGVDNGQRDTSTLLIEF